MGPSKELAGQFKILTRRPFFFKMACKQNLDSRCVLISDPGALGAGAKTRLHTPKDVAYHDREQHDALYIMIGHSLGRNYGIQHKEGLTPSKL